jgi:hypothetical protein
MGGNRVKQQTKDLVIDTWLRKRKNNPMVSAAEVLSAVDAHIKANKPRGVSLPSLRKIQYILKDAKPKYEDSTEELQQRPWSMATLVDFKLSEASLPHVLLVWRYCCHTGEQFTIRQAKWVSRLCHIPPFALSITMLWCMSYMYARKEELSVASNKPRDTFFDDAHLVMDDLELQTFLKVTDRQSITDQFGLGLPINQVDHGVVEEALHPIDYYTDLLNGIISNQRDKALIDKLINIPSLSTLDLPSEIEMIYHSWLTYIKKSKQWPKMTADQAVEVVLALRKWAHNLQSIRRIGRQPVRIKVTRTPDQAHIIAYPDPIATPEEALGLLTEYGQKEGGK